MTDFLVKKFIRNYDKTKSAHVRRSYGTLSSIVGIICNVILFTLKYLVGTIANSISIVSDAFNNLSDCLSCFITLLGYKMASKPADKKHPFGHGRIEYLTSLSIAVVILFVGIELLKNSFMKIIHPEEVTFSISALIALSASILVKLWMSLFNTKLGKMINSSVMTATAKDSRSDVIATLAALIALVASLFTDIPVDGIMGLAVSLFIIRSGYEIIRDMTDELIGRPADPELIETIRMTVTSDKKILGLHDLMIHSYGPGNQIGSCHAEVSYKEDLMTIHDVVDKIERDIRRKTGVNMTIHIDPVETDSELRTGCKQMIQEIISGISDELDFHDFRVVKCDECVNLIFDIAVPDKFKYDHDEIHRLIDEELGKHEGKYFTVIVFDRKN